MAARLFHFHRRYLFWIMLVGTAGRFTSQAFRLSTPPSAFYRGYSSTFSALSGARAMSSVPDSMNAVVVREFGGLDSLSYETDYPVPTINDDEVLVKNEYAGLNFIDTYHRTGLYPTPLPFVLGSEGGGTVVQVPPSVTDVKVGDKVAYLNSGTYCDYTPVPAAKIVKVPDSLSFETAMGCMLQGLTAHYLVTDAAAGLIQPGEWCLIYSVGSGTGQWAAQMAKLKGFKVIGTTSAGKADSVADLCDELIVLDTVEGKTYSDYESVDIPKRVMEVTGGVGAKAIMDGVGKSTSAMSIQCLATRGIWITFGNASGAAPPLNLLDLAPKSAFCTRPKLFDYVATREELQMRAQEVFQWAEEGKLRVKVDTVFPLSEVQKGHEYLESGLSKGKVLFKL